MALPNYVIISLDWLQSFKGWNTGKEHALTPQAVVTSFATLPTTSGGQDAYEEKFMTLCSELGGSLFEDSTPDEYGIFEDMVGEIVSMYYDTINSCIPYSALGDPEEEEEYLLVDWVNPTTVKLGLKSLVLD